MFIVIEFAYEVRVDATLGNTALLDLQADYAARSAMNQFKAMLRESEQTVLALEDRLRHWRSSDSEGDPPADLDTLIDRIDSSCTDCHRRFRDAPLTPAESR